MYCAPVGERAVHERPLLCGLAVAPLFRRPVESSPTRRRLTSHTVSRRRDRRCKRRGAFAGNWLQALPAVSLWEPCE
jgi:hypothetical protein